MHAVNDNIYHRLITMMISTFKPSKTICIHLNIKWASKTEHSHIVPKNTFSQTGGTSLQGP